MFNFDNFVLPVIKESSVGNAAIVKENDFYSLLVNSKIQMTEDDNKKISAKQFYGCYDISEGEVLTSGLGFGILAKMLCEKDNISSVTVVENNKNVIDLFLLNNNIFPKMNIIYDDIYTFKTSKSFDTIILDHYEDQSLSDQLNDIKILFKILPDHKKLFSWRMELIYCNYLKNNISFYDENRWQKFKEYVKIDTLPDLSLDKISEYCKYYANSYKKL